jgi:hypothetical protein
MNTSSLARRSNRLIIYVIISIVVLSVALTLLGDLLGEKYFNGTVSFLTLIIGAVVISIAFHYYQWRLTFKPFKSVLQEIATEKKGELKKNLSSITVKAENLELFYCNGELKISYMGKKLPNATIQRTGAHEWTIDLTIEDQQKHDEYYIKTLDTLKKAKLMRFYIDRIYMYNNSVDIILSNFELSSKKIIRFIKYMKVALKD